MSDTRIVGAVFGVEVLERSLGGLELVLDPDHTLYFPKSRIPIPIDIKDILDGFSELTPTPSEWPEASQPDIEARRARYLDPGWTERRERPR